MNKLFSIIIYFVLIPGLIANGYFMVTNGSPEEIWWWLLAVGFFVWGAVPYVGIAAADKRILTNTIGKIILLITALTITGSGIYILIEAFIINLDPQSGLIFIFLPFFQSVIAAIGIGIVLLIKVVNKNKSLSV
jgi:hypothetical protein